MPAALNGSRVLLTGASGGIGHAIARALHARGASLVLTSRRTEVLEELAATLGERVEVKGVDLCDSEALHRLAEEAGAVDVLVANAGIPGTGRLEEYSCEQIDRVLDVNLRAPVHLTHALLPGMLERGRGQLVFMASISGKVATAHASLYNATKFGLRGFAFAVREDTRGTGIGATTVFPGPISDAGMWADAGLDLPFGVTPRTPEQVARAVVDGIERDRAEVDVAHPLIRLGGWLAGPAPRVVAAINRRGGTNRIAAQLAERQEAKRWALCRARRGGALRLRQRGRGRGSRRPAATGDPGAVLGAITPRSAPGPSGRRVRLPYPAS